jgi:hypothetical protein
MGRVFTRVITTTDAETTKATAATAVTTPRAFGRSDFVMREDYSEADRCFSRAVPRTATASVSCCRWPAPLKARLGRMSQPPAGVPTERFAAVLVRQYTVGRLSLMHSGPISLLHRRAVSPTNSSPGLGDGPPAVAVEVGPTALAITELPGTISTQWIGDGRMIRYPEISDAQAVRNSTIYLARTPSPHEVPFGVRLYLGESRSHILLFTAEVEALMDALESHHVPVDRTPRKLGFMLMGRK